MPWMLSDKEFEAVVLLPGEQRYRYLINHVADQEQIWGLADDEGWALASDDDGRQLVPVWPHQRYAAACATGSWSGYTPRAIEIQVWLRRWLPGIQADRRQIAAFPTANGAGVVVAPERFASDLEDELAQYE